LTLVKCSFNWQCQSVVFMCFSWCTEYGTFSCIVSESFLVAFHLIESIVYSLWRWWSLCLLYSVFNIVTYPWLAKVGPLMWSIGNQGTKSPNKSVLWGWYMIRLSAKKLYYLQRLWLNSITACSRDFGSVCATIQSAQLASENNVRCTQLCSEFLNLSVKYFCTLFSQMCRHTSLNSIVLVVFERWNHFTHVGMLEVYMYMVYI